MMEPDLDDRLRHRFATIPFHQQADPAVAIVAITRHLRRRHRRRVTVRAVAAIVVVAGIVTAFVVRHEERQQVVTKPSPEALGQPVELLTVGWQEGPRVADPETGDVAAIGPTMPTGWQWCNTCLVVQAGGKAFTAQNGRLFSFTPGAATLRDIGSANVVFPTPTGDALFVSVARQIEKRSLDGTTIAGPWTLPDGYFLTEQPHAVTGGFIVTNKTSIIGDLAWWDPSTGAVHQLGKYNQFVDAHPGSPTDTLAWTVCPTGLFPCSLVIGHLDGTGGRTIDPPVDGNGFYLGGAFSQDGSTLATTISMHPGVSNPDAALALVDVATGRTTVVSGSRFGVGEPYGYVTWSPDGGTIFFTGDNGVRSYDVSSGRITDLAFPGTYYSVAALPGLDRRAQCPRTDYRPQGQPTSDKSGDGLPVSGAVTEAVAQASLESARQQYGAQRAYVWAEPGRARKQKADGTIAIVSELLYTDVLELSSRERCPQYPAFFNGVALTFLVPNG